MDKVLQRNYQRLLRHWSFKSLLTSPATFMGNISHLPARTLGTQNYKKFYCAALKGVTSQVFHQFGKVWHFMSLMSPCLPKHGDLWQFSKASSETFFCLVSRLFVSGVLRFIYARKQPQSLLPGILISDPYL